MRNGLNTQVYVDEKKGNKNSNIATRNGVLIVQAYCKMQAIINSNVAVMECDDRCGVTVVSHDSVTYIGTLLP